MSGGPGPEGDRVRETGSDDPGPAPSEDRSDSEAAAEAVVGDLAALDQERNELVDTLRRVQADFENYRKRVMREQTELAERGTERLLESLLPVLDSFDLALSNLGADEPSRKGVELVYRELLGVLERAGLERIESDGKRFDPNEHEAVMQSDGDGEPVVAMTMRPGYRVKDRVLRPAMVNVDSRRPSSGDRK